MEQLQADLQLVRIYRSIRQCRFGKALRGLDELLNDRPDHGIAHGLMGWLCEGLLDDPQRARVHYRYAIRFAPALEAHYHKLAELLVTLGDETGLADLDRLAAAQGTVDRTPILLAGAQLRERQGRWAEAWEHYRIAAANAVGEEAEEVCSKGMDRMLRRANESRWSPAVQV